MNKFKFLLASLVTASLLGACAGDKQKEYVDYVNPYIGNISHLLVPTFPTVQLHSRAARSHTRCTRTRRCSPRAPSRTRTLPARETRK